MDYELEDFPAAHSMDSGWFAIDEEGNLAHFDTGEAGALPNDVTFMTGEAGAYGENQDLWFELVLPWIARNMDPDEVAEFGLVYALFESEEAAAAAVEAGGREVGENPLFVEVPWQGDEPRNHIPRFKEMPGFVGFAPDPFEAQWDDSELLPVVLYQHGEWDIPGHYVRHNLPPRQMKLDDEWLARLKTFPVRFATDEEIQLADFYSNDDCDSWSQADLRTGEMPEQPEPAAGESMMDKFLRFMGLKK